ncbi:integrase catalytic domain-containing protein, partial [Trichonephila clavata]
MLKSAKKEVCSYCKGRHARAICFKLENSLKQNSHIDLEKGKVDVKPTSSNSVLHNRGGVLLAVCKAEVIGHISSDKIFCLFDNGSEKSFIKKNVSRRLGLKKGKCDEQSDCTSVHLIHSEEESISAELRRFWEIESLGIRDNDSVSLGNGDEEILSEFDKSVCFVDGRYRVSLPWKTRNERVWLVASSTPLEFLGPFVIKIEVSSSRSWTLGVDWDSELPPKLRHKWQQWSSEAEGLTEIKNTTVLFRDVDQELSSVDIHCFSDASKSAYGTILYLRFVTCNNKIETSFICSKSRVAPLKSLTLPRLELTAALLSARLAKQVSSCLKFNANIYYWTDSLISYYWICGDSSAFKPYIKNRVQEIQLLSDPSQWGHCPGKDNPADLISRGTSAVKLAQNELWWHGPPWLKLAPDHWPNRQRDILDSELCSEELEYRSSVHVAVTQQRESLVDINRFSSLKKLLKVTAWVFRFVNNARIVNKSMNFYITADEIQNAEYFWLKYVQYEFYSAEILTLKRNEQLRCSSEIKSLVPYLGEDNLLRITGRLLEADLCFGEKHPVILPRHCKFTELLVIREHERIGHCGVSATLTQLRKIIGYLKVVSLVKTIIR